MITYLGLSPHRMGAQIQHLVVSKLYNNEEKSLMLIQVFYNIIFIYIKKFIVYPNIFINFVIFKYDSKFTINPNIIISSAKTKNIFIYGKKSTVNPNIL